MKTTNYLDTIIEVADDCPAHVAAPPPERGGKRTVANIQYDMIASEPYRYTSDDVVFHAFAVRNNVPEEDHASERERFFAKGQPCLRTSPLAKRYGWGIHHDPDGKVALVAVESDEYRQLVADDSVKRVRAMRSGRAK